MAFKVLDSYGSGWESDVIAGIERAVDPDNDGDFSDRVDIANMSLGGSGNPDDAVSKSVVNFNFPEFTDFSRSSFNPGSNNGALPLDNLLIVSELESKAITSKPKSAKHAAATVP